MRTILPKTGGLSKKKKTILIVSIVLFVLSAGAGGYLLWRVSQPETIAPEDSEAVRECFGLDRTITLKFSPYESSEGKLEIVTKLGKAEIDLENNHIEQKFNNSCDTVDTIRAVPKAGYVFDHWYDSKSDRSFFEPEITPKFAQGDSTLRAVYKKDSETECLERMITVKFSPYESSEGKLEIVTDLGKAKIVEDVENNHIEQRFNNSCDTIDTIRAVPKAEYVFDHWYDSKGDRSFFEPEITLQFAQVESQGDSTLRAIYTKSRDSIPPVVEDPVDARCGSNAKTYEATQQDWPTTTKEGFCAVGQPEPAEPVFPSEDSSVAWLCKEGSENVTCKAFRKETEKPPVGSSTDPSEGSTTAEENSETTSSKTTTTTSSGSATSPESTSSTEATTTGEFPETGIFDNVKASLSAGSILLFLGMLWSRIDKHTAVTATLLGVNAGERRKKNFEKKIGQRI
ncbi:MAG: hypothetical protein PHP96_00960 [Candidatus Dojkabacteria bacterium]|nr:hypothetical protein [Candidatus Dojkabacteria bacterium]